LNIAPPDRIPTSQSKTATLSFATQTQLASGQLIVISWPANYLSGSIGVQYATASVFATTASVSSGQAFIAVGSAGPLMPGSYTVTLTGATIGGPIVASASTGIFVSTTDASGNTIDAAGVGGYPALGGQVSSASFSVAARDRVPSATGKMLTVSFTTQTQLLAGNFVTINYPAGFFGTSNSATVFSPATTFNSPVQQTQSLNTNNFVLTVGNAAVNPGTITVIIQGVTMGPNPRVTPCYVNDVSVSTSTDIQSIVPVAAGSLGGQVQNIALTMSDQARQQPGATNQQVTITFVTQNDLNPNISPNNAISISWPNGYLSPSGAAYQIGYALSPNPFANANVQSAQSSGLKISIANGVLVPAGLYTITLSGVTLGPSNPGSALTGLSISTTQDAAGVAGYPSIGIQNPQVSRVRFTIAPADRIPGAGSSTSKIVTVAFTTQTALQQNQIVSLQWPSGYLQPPNSGSAILYYGMLPPGVPPGVFPNTFSSTTNNGARIAVTAALPAGTYTLYLANFILGANPGNSAVNCNPSSFASTFSVATYTINNVPIDQPGYSTYPAIGGAVTNVQFTNAAEDRVAGISSRTATVTFTTQTPLEPSPSSPSVFIAWPLGYMGAYPIGVISPMFLNFSSTVGVPYVSQSAYLTLIVPLPAGTYSVTLTGLTMGSPTAPGNGLVPQTAIVVSTVFDSPGLGGYPEIGGQVTATALQIAAVDRVASYTNRKVVFSFTTATSLACGDTITLTVPTNFFGGTPTSYLDIPISTKPVMSTIGQQQTIVFSLNSTVAAGPQSITFCGLILFPFPSNQLCGVSVTTSRDYTTVFAQTGIIGQPNGGQVSGVSMVIPWSNRIAFSTQQNATFTFTTATSMVTSGFISMMFPSNFFVPNAASACGGLAPTPISVAVSGIPGYTMVSQNSNSFFLSGGSLAAGTYTATLTGLTFGAATVGFDTGISISTQRDSASFGATSGPLSGFQVTGFSLPSCQILPNTCQSATLSFLSNAGPVSPGQQLIIHFTGQSPLVAATPSVINPIQIGNAYITGTVTSQSQTTTTVTLTVNPNFGAFVPGSSVTTITLSGLGLSNTGLVQPGIVTIGNANIGQSTPLWSGSYYSTSSGLTNTTGLTINDPFIGAQNTQATISFTTMNPINVGDTVVVVFPTGFFINTPAAPNNGCPSTAPNYNAAAYSPSGTCGNLQTCQRVFTGSGPSGSLTITPATPGYSAIVVNLGQPQQQQLQPPPQGVQLPAGPNTIVFTGLTMSTTAVAASNSIFVLTSNDACSAGMISSGSISARLQNSPKITLGNSIASSTANSMTINLQPSTSIPSDSMLYITLTGAVGINCGANQPVSSSSSGLVVGFANIVSYVLVIRLINSFPFSSNQSISLTLGNITNPSTAHVALNNISAAILDSTGSTVAIGSTGTFPMIIGNLGLNQPAITLSTPIAGATGVTMSVLLTPSVPITSPSVLAITLTGSSGVSCPPGQGVTFGNHSSATTPAAAASFTNNVLSVFFFAGSFPAGQQIQFSIVGVTNPASAQPALSSVAAAITAVSSALAGSLSGTFIAIRGVQTLNAPLYFGQEIPQASYTRTYTAAPQVMGVLATSNVTATLTASSQAISFSNVPISGLTSPLTAAHIHGPCQDANPCNAPVVYVICSNTCPSGISPIIPAFTVDITQLNSAGVASAAGLYQGIMAGNKLYYLNFHTAT
jgi:hypothetical protein